MDRIEVLGNSASLMIDLLKKAYCDEMQIFANISLILVHWDKHVRNRSSSIRTSSQDASNRRISTR
jgi:hypothetical protein